MGGKDIGCLVVLVVFLVWLVLSVSGGTIMGTSWLLDEFYFDSVDYCRTIMVKILLNWWNFGNYSSTQWTYGVDGDGLLRACVRYMGSDGSNNIAKYCNTLVLQNLKVL